MKIKKELIPTNKLQEISIKQIYHIIEFLFEPIKVDIGKIEMPKYLSSFNSEEYENRTFSGRLESVRNGKGLFYNKMAYYDEVLNTQDLLFDLKHKQQEFIKIKNRKIRPQIKNEIIELFNEIFYEKKKEYTSQETDSQNQKESNHKHPQFINIENLIVSQHNEITQQIINVNLNEKEDVETKQGTSNATPPKTSFEFKNNFDTVNENRVFEHFKGGLVDSKMLTEDELKEYLTQAFEKQTPPKTLFSLKNIQSKKRVIQVFYEYYKDVAGKPHRKQKIYVGLLCDYFQGYKTSTVSTNFSKI